MNRFDEWRQVADGPRSPRILKQGSKDIVIGYVFDFTNDNFESKILCSRLDDVQRLRMYVIGNKERVGSVLACSFTKRHRFGSGGCFIQQRSVRHFHSCQIHHHLLKRQQAFQSALRDFSLVGRVSRVPARILQHVSQNYIWGVRPVITHPNHRSFDLVLLRVFSQNINGIYFGRGRRKIQIVFDKDVGRNG